MSLTKHALNCWAKVENKQKETAFSPTVFRRVSVTALRIAASDSKHVTAEVLETAKWLL